MVAILNQWASEHHLGGHKGGETANGKNFFSFGFFVVVVIYNAKCLFLYLNVFNN